MVFDKMAAICLGFKWLGFSISDPIQNPDIRQPNLFSTIQNSLVQIPNPHCNLKSQHKTEKHWNRNYFEIAWQNELTLKSQM